MQRIVAAFAAALSWGVLAAGNTYSPSFDETAERIREGKLDVGASNTLDFPGRFHTIHSNALGMGCLACHTSPAFSSDHLFLRTAEFPQRGQAGAVGRTTCIGCHKEGGSATPFFGLTEK